LPAPACSSIYTCSPYGAGSCRRVAGGTATRAAEQQAARHREGQSADRQMYTGGRWAAVHAAWTTPAHGRLLCSRPPPGHSQPYGSYSQVANSVERPHKHGTGGGIPADISLGTANGVGAAQYINRHLAVLPVLRPLILAVKAFLRENGLNEVTVCGSSSTLPLLGVAVLRMLCGHQSRPELLRADDSQGRQASAEHSYALRNTDMHTHARVC
jgi:hypothetical protein